MSSKHPLPAYLNTKQSYELRSKQKIVVQDKAKQSHREQQEKLMRDIVFDDGTSPCFRVLENTAEEKSFEQMAKQSTVFIDGDD